MIRQDPLTQPRFEDSSEELTRSPIDLIFDVESEKDGPEAPKFKSKRGSDVAHLQTHARAMDNASQLDGTV